MLPISPATQFRLSHWPLRLAIGRLWIFTPHIHMGGTCRLVPRSSTGSPEIKIQTFLICMIASHRRIPCSHRTTSKRPTLDSSAITLRVMTQDVESWLCFTSEQMSEDDESDQNIGSDRRKPGLPLRYALVASQKPIDIIIDGSGLSHFYKSFNLQNTHAMGLSDILMLPSCLSFDGGNTTAYYPKTGYDRVLVA